MSVADLYGTRDDLSGRYFLIRPDGDRFAIREITPKEVAELVAWKADSRRQNISSADGGGGERK